MVLLVGGVSAEQFSFGGGSDASGFTGGYRTFGASVSPQFNQPGFGAGSGFNPSTYWSNIEQADCRERQDIFLTIPPGGCSPDVVRSDLLEEQNVPIFCKVSSVQVNPLIDISKIRSVRFKGEYPK